ncbi:MULTISPECIES: ribosome biogenesis GTPase YlqF [unclassified Colwellia]|uniref:ribosome biogenesis GTPase YlqF n=1 Tax=unclassified Colwellia TaxID=196834 RepID=UPI0015F5766C|nr:MULTISPECIES: ribosome biogenesis GTPase YlqF [unclassified Colwellia]MBA6232001.1 ribosome biogenesis GTPase YlqF [Colwellia sp. MB02u-7]MBA6236603.1 ribosome biogenesis GTPase YlqF [Colwellia sp. MB02u-11]MBA6254767.1 ribosome biogenesis GTPase YlqF [Colwellia sp. MB3u-28]MBA6259277.1 ribosome biogenesis GTPase YlqF [Colwellia sp. MB3u-41]MBA6298948.1 ribosome biogenesis GTPase YlqF [Colwellia sp. MB3u-22]
MAINWFPGHMHKAQKEIKEILPQIDVVIEVCDARLPFSSENPMITEIRGDIPLIKILNKSDLADPAKTQLWLEYLESQKNVKAIALTTDNPSVAKTLPSLIRKLVPSKNETGKQINVVIMGIPNVGKSTLLNTLVGKAKAKVGNEPAVTKGQQRIRLDEGLYLYDTPGMLWPKIINENSGYRLAITSAVKDTAFDHEDIAAFAGEYLLANYPDRLQERYQLKELPETEVELLEEIGRRRGCVRSGGRIDLHKAAAILINEIRDKTLGEITFETPDMIEVETLYFIEQEAKKVAAREAKKTARGRGRKNKR